MKDADVAAVVGHPLQEGDRVPSKLEQVAEQWSVRKPRQRGQRQEAASINDPAGRR
jgi:hypothetical protein